MSRTHTLAAGAASAVTLILVIATSASAAPVDIADETYEIPLANTIWEAFSWNQFFVLGEASVFADTVNSVDPWPTDQMNGGAFDGALGIWVDGDVYGTHTCDHVVPCSYVVDVTTSGGDVVVQGPSQEISGLQVAVQQRYYAAGDIARVLASYHNPTTAPITVDTGAYSNYGSDEDTVLEADATDDADVTAADRWIITGDDGDYDPVVTTVFLGPGHTLAPDYSSVFDGGTSQSGFTLTVQPGQTVHLAFFAGIHGWDPEDLGAGVVLADDLAATVVIADDYPAAVAAAIADTSEFDSFTGRLTAGLTPGTVVLNWGTVQAAPADPVTADPNFTG